MDRKREEHPFISKLVAFVELVILFILVGYILKALRLYKDRLVIETDEIVLSVDITSTNSDEVSGNSLSDQEASEQSETPVEALTPLPISRGVEKPEQASPEGLETQIDALDAKSSVSADLAAEAEVDVLTGEAYCMKCKQKRDMQNVHKIVTKNGRNALEGICPICGTRLFRFVSQ